MNMRDLVLYTIFTGTRLDMGRVVSIRDLVLHTISITGTRSDLVLCTITGTRLDMDRAVSMRDLVLHTITGVRLDMGRATSVTRYPGWARCPPGCGRCHWWGQRSSVTGTAGQCQSEMTPYVIIITIVTTTLLRTTLCLLVLGAQSTKCKHWVHRSFSRPLKKNQTQICFFLNGLLLSSPPTPRSVSYTHLTLPTMAVV